MAEYVDSAVQTVLSSSRLKLAHPGNAKLTQVYPTPSETTSVLAQAINHRGQFRVSPNNLGFNSRSDFILSSSALISEMAINGVITIVNDVGPLTWKPNCIGYAFDLIESIEITYSNSLMQNMFIRGETLKDYSLLCCCSHRERVDMLKSAGECVAHNGGAPPVANVYRFTVPISFLNHTPGSLRNSWPVDGSVLAGPIQIAVNWRPFRFGFVRTQLAVSPVPVSFTSLELVAKTTQLQDASFSVKKAMMLDPQLVYSLPARYITSVDYSRAIGPGPDNAGADTTINLASAPSGMLEGIIISIRPTGGVDGEDNWLGGNVLGNINNKGGSVTLDRIVLEFGGQNLFRCESHEEYQHYMRSTFGDDMEWPNVQYTQNLAWDDEGLGTNVLFHNVYFIPLVNDGASVFRGHTNENLVSYGGSQLQLTIRPSFKLLADALAPRGQRALMGPGGDAADKLGARAVSLTGATQSVCQEGAVYQIWIGFLISGLVEISQGTVDLQL